LPGEQHLPERHAEAKGGYPRGILGKGKPWQNLIEARSQVQLRLADFKFEQAQTLGEVQNHHAGFIETCNTTSH
jgi:hypothetical protein